MAIRKQRKWKISLVRSYSITGMAENQWWWHLRAENGGILAHSETYTTKAKARKTAKRVFALMDPERVQYEEVEE